MLGRHCLRLVVTLVAPGLGMLSASSGSEARHTPRSASPLRRPLARPRRHPRANLQVRAKLGARAYELGKKGGRMLLRKTVLTGCHGRAAKALSLYTTLTWKVRATSGHGPRPILGARVSTSRSIPMRRKAPSPTRTPTFASNKVAHATGYELRVYQGSRLLLRKTGVKKATYRSPTSLPTYVSLTWKVRGLIGHKARPWSKTFESEDHPARETDRSARR